MKIVAAALFLSRAVFAAELSGDALLEDAMVHPGGYSQMCMMPPPVKNDVPLRLYGLQVSRHFSLSSDVAERLRLRRADVVPVLAQRLMAMDLMNLPRVAPEKKDKTSVWPSSSGFDSHRLSGLMLAAVMELKAVETLPGLLKVEAQLQALIEAGEKDPAAPLPDLAIDGISYPAELDIWERPPKGDPKQKANVKEILRLQALLRCRVFQREVLSVMAKLLREARFQPLLESSIEQAYGKRLREAAEKRGIKSREDIPKDERGFVQWDEIQNVADVGWVRADVPYNAEVRAQIRGFAEQYIAQYPVK